MKRKMERTVIICFIFVIITSVNSQNLSQIETEVVRLDREQCWKLGGATANLQYANTSTEMGSPIKMGETKNGVEIFNFGMQYYPENGPPDDNSKKDGMKQGFGYFLKIFQGELSWDRPAVNDQMCERVLDYKCLQDITINNMYSLKKFNEMNCPELKKDLIIKELGSMGSMSFEGFEKIQKIHGRLVIENIHAELILDFKNLTEVGGYGENKESPSIEIRGNFMSSIKFPKIPMNKCKPKSKRNCVSIEDNWTLDGWNMDKPYKPLRIQFRSLEVLHQSNRREILNTENDSELWLKERERLMKDPAALKREYDPIVRDWVKEAYGGEDLSIIFGVPTLLIFGGLIGYTVWFFKVQWKNYETYDFEAIEREDDKESPNNDEDYFKLDGKQEKDRDSAMDDLGSN